MICNKDENYIMKTIKPLKSLILSFFFITGSCNPYLQVTSNYDKSINFHQYKTFGIYHLDVKQQKISPEEHELILNAVKSEMIEKGFGENITPDLWVNIVIVLIEKNTEVSDSDFYRYGSIFRPYGFGTGTASRTITQSHMPYKDGTLIVDEIDTKTGHLVWEGIGNSEFDKPLTHPEKKIPVIVKSVMAGFPPKTN